jgi:vitellogenic carboxypeptidase-like protein
MSPHIAVGSGNLAPAFEHTICTVLAAVHEATIYRWQVDGLFRVATATLLSQWQPAALLLSPHAPAGMASDLYEGLWTFFDQHPELQQRPLFIAGESYAGKYIPSLAHYIMSAAASRPWRRREQQQQQQEDNQQPDSHVQHHQQQQQQDAEFCSSLQELQQRVRSSKQHLTLLVPLLRRRALQRCPGLLRHAPQQQQQQQQQQAPSSFDDGVPEPNFQLAGIAIGNGLTDPIAQTRALGSVTFNFGLISEATRTQLQQQAEVVIMLVQAQQWQEAAQMRSRLLEFIEQASGVATLLDIRRTAAYDSAEAVQTLLNSTEVKAVMHADASVEYASCSDAVDAVLKADTLKSARALVEDILDVLPVLVYQGQFDAQDGERGHTAGRVTRALVWGGCVVGKRCQAIESISCRQQHGASSSCIAMLHGCVSDLSCFCDA